MAERTFLARIRRLFRRKRHSVPPQTNPIHTGHVQTAPTSKVDTEPSLDPGPVPFSTAPPAVPTPPPAAPDGDPETDGSTVNTAAPPATTAQDLAPAGPGGQLSRHTHTDPAGSRSYHVYVPAGSTGAFTRREDP